MPYYVITTFDDPEMAKKIGREAVEANLAACVSIIPALTSIYRWKGSIDENEEVMCLFKTVDEKVSDLEEFIRKEHTYEVPEIVSMKMDRISEDYRAWLVDSCRVEE